MVKKGRPRNNKIKKAAALAATANLKNEKALDNITPEQQITKNVARGESLPLLNTVKLLSLPGFEGGSGSFIKLLFRHPTTSDELLPTWVQVLQHEPGGDVLLQPLDLQEKPPNVKMTDLSNGFKLERIKLTDKERCTLHLMMDKGIWENIFRQIGGVPASGVSIVDGFGRKLQMDQRDMLDAFISFIARFKAGDIQMALSIAHKVAEMFLAAENGAKVTRTNSSVHQQHLRQTSISGDLRGIHIKQVQYVIRDISTMEESDVAKSSHRPLSTSYA